MNSRIFEGRVAHERSRPAHNRFRYPVFMLYLDLAEIDQIAATVPRFAYNRFGMVSFFDRDHGPRDGTPLRPWIDSLLSRAGVDVLGGPVRILAFPRGLWFRFYPIAFWYCFSPDGVLRAVLVEVHNTFGGRHNYLLHRSGEPIGFSEDLFADKAMHVSPFMGMDARYRFRLTEPGETVSATIHVDFEGAPILVAGVSGKARPLDNATLRELSRRYGPLPLRAWLLIHLQAIRLASKRVPFYHDPGTPTEETGIDPQRTAHYSD